MRVKINLKLHSWGSDERSYILPPMDNDDAQAIATAIAQSQNVTPNRIGDSGVGGGDGNVLVTDPSSAVSVELIDDSAVMTKRQYADAVATFKAERAREQADEAAKARELAEATV